MSELNPDHSVSTPRLHVRCPECDGWDATEVNCPHGCGVRLEAPFVERSDESDEEGHDGSR